MLDGRDYVVPDDVKALAVPVLAHRVIVKSAGMGASTEAAADSIRDILGKVTIPA
jgi:MoxR-like ATPase